MSRTQVMLTIIGLIGLPFVLRAAEPSLGGKCPVCLFEMGKPVPGNKDIQATFDRQTFLFPDEKAQAMFKANPGKYTPVLAGDCVVCLVEMGVRMPGKAEVAFKHQDRLYLFPSEKQLTMFKENPRKYADADAPLGSYCPICLVEAKKWIKGKKEFTSVYDGMRYQFPEAAIKQKFDANPARYVPALAGNCTVCLKDGGKHVRGSMDLAMLHQNRAYLFPDAGAKNKFAENPSAYANVDLANQGNCIVCQKLAGKAVPGSTEHVSVYKGKRYLFPSEKEQSMFDADPGRFTTDSKTGAQSTQTDASRTLRVTIAVSGMV